MNMEANLKNASERGKISGFLHVNDILIKMSEKVGIVGHFHEKVGKSRSRSKK